MRLRVVLGFLALMLVPEFNAVGRLTAVEVFLAIAAGLAFFRKTDKQTDVRTFYVLLAVWLVGAVLTDTFRHSGGDDVARGISKIVFFGLNFAGIRALVKKDADMLVWFILWLFIASSLRVALGITLDELTGDVFGNAWKFGHGQLFTAVVFWTASVLRTKRLLLPVSTISPFAAGIVNLYLNARNLSGVTFLAALVNLVTANRSRPFSSKAIFVFSLVLLSSAFGVMQIYEISAGSGLLGEDAKGKYLLQTQGNLSLLQGGRSESLASTQAIVDSPILGHGSYARDSTYIELMVSRLEEAGFNVQGDPFKDDVIPSHSHLFGSWVEHGFLGALFWMWIVWLTASALIANLRNPTPLGGFISFIGVSLLWDVFFSPFGLERRVITAAWVYLMILTKESGNQSRSERARRVF